MVAVLPPSMPLPLLATTLDTLFNRFHTPAVSLMSAPVACAVAAGVRSALVVDIGWAETAVTAVYEYREVQTTRSVRAGKLLVENTHKLLASALGGGQQATSAGEGGDEETFHRVVSFEECEEVANRLVWCKPARGSPSPDQQEGLPTVAEQDEFEANIPSAANASSSISIPLRSTSTPTKLDMTYEQLSTPAETTFFDSDQPSCFFDDHELPLSLLIYRSLLKLPLDVRGLCMARIIFTGGGANVLGLRARIFEEVKRLIETQGWDAVQGKGVEAYKTNPKLRRGSKQASNDGPTGVESSQQDGGPGGGSGVTGHEQDGVWVDAPSDAQQEPDPVEEQLRKRKDEKPRLQGQLRAVESLGAWSGASLLIQLKVPALSTVEREAWREQGLNGASRPGEVDQKIAQRQSMGAGGLMRNAGANWTLGVWGYL